MASRNNLAATYQDAGRAAEAIRLHERTLADRERVLGPDHPDTMKSRHKLANAYRVAGRVRLKLHRQSRYVIKLPAILAELCRIVHRLFSRWMFK